MSVVRSLAYGTFAAAMAICVVGSAEAGEKNWAEKIFSQTAAKRDEPNRLGGTQSTDVHASHSVLASRSTIANIDRAIARYTAIHRSGGWPTIPRGRSLRFGDDGARVARLRRRLAKSGDLRTSRGNRNTTFDRAVEQAVKRFQRRHGLTPSGRVNRLTLAALNVSSTRRLHQLTINRARTAALLQKTAGHPYVLVNIPAYELQSVRHGRVELHSRVVVGKPNTPTPIFSKKIVALNTMPYWHVPQSIVRRQIIPAVRKDRGYLSRQNIRVFAGGNGAELDRSTIARSLPRSESLAFRQDPGPQNALGLLRIDMPNTDNVYMHDTPLKKLFRYHLRPYSAGCVRVKNVVELGEWLLQIDGQSSGDRLRSEIRAQRKTTFALRNPVAVHFAYVTAWATAEGSAHFRADIYNKDGPKLITAALGGWSAAVRSTQQ